VAWNASQSVFTDLGRFEITGKDEDRGAFKTPTLREIARTAPYMHDGSLLTQRSWTSTNRAAAEPTAGPGNPAGAIHIVRETGTRALSGIIDGRTLTTSRASAPFSDLSASP
jgi:hypothetical protein